MVVGRRGGKTELALNEIIKASVTVPGYYWYVGPSYKQVKTIAWTRLKALLEDDPDWKFNEQELSAVHPYIGTRIELKGADNEDSLVGVGLHGVIMDEAALTKHTVWPLVIRPMLADHKGWALFISTPRGENWFYDLYKKNDPDWQSWHYPTSVNEYIDRSEIAELRKDMSERLFKQEVMAEFLDDATGVFKGVSKCVVGDLKDPVQGRLYVMGADLAKTVDFTVLTVIDTVTREVVAFERFQDVSWVEQKVMIQKLASKYNNAIVYIDSTGVGSPIYDDLQNAGVAVEGYTFSNKTKTQLVEQLCISIERRLITFPDIEHLVQELKSFEYSLTPSGVITYGAPSGKHDDCVMSLGLANWGIRTYTYEAQVVKDHTPKDDEIDRVGRGQLEYEYETSDVMDNIGGI